MLRRVVSVKFAKTHALLAPLALLAASAVLTETAKHSQATVQLLESLINEDSQAWYAGVNGEYPVRADIPPRPLLAQWGAFKADERNLSRPGELNGEAVLLMDRAGWK